MVPLKRRAVLAAALTLPVALAPRKPRAAAPGLGALSRLQPTAGAAVPASGSWEQAVAARM